MRKKLIMSSLISFILILSCVEQHGDSISIGKQLESVLTHYVDTAHGFESCFIMSANRLFNANQYKEGILIGPMYRELLLEMPYLRPFILFKHSTTTIYIDSALVPKIPFVSYKDTSLIFVNQQPEAGALFDYVKRGVLIDISHYNDKKIRVLSADTLFLPLIKKDRPLLDKPFEKDSCISRDTSLVNQ